MTTKSYLLLLLLSSVITLGCVGVNITGYTGDGKIEKVGKWPLSHGYEINFGEVKLNENFRREFSIENFPDIGKSFDFCIKVIAKSKSLNELKNGQLHMRVSTEDGKVFFDIKEDITKWTFSEYQVDDSTVESFIFYFNNQKGSYIDAEKLEGTSKIKFFVELVGIEKNPPVSGEIMMRVGGYK